MIKLTFKTIKDMNQFMQQQKINNEAIQDNTKSIVVQAYLRLYAEDYNRDYADCKIEDV